MGDPTTPSSDVKGCKWKGQQWKVASEKRGLIQKIDRTRPYLYNSQEKIYVYEAVHFGESPS